MIIHHLRNATFVIETAKEFILIDPMLGSKGSIPPFAFFRFKCKMNPLVDLPDNSSEILGKVTQCLITHSQKFGIKILQHTDHLDKTGEKFLRDSQIPISTLTNDGKVLSKYGLNIENKLEYWNKTACLGGNITAIPAQHGHTWVHKLMANGAGYFIEIPDEPSIYLSGDTVLTDDVKRALKQLKPDIAVLAAGSATLDISKPILMSLEEILEFIQLAPGKVIANHLEALNHCPVTRGFLLEQIESRGFEDKVYIPEDGDSLHFTS